MKNETKFWQQVKKHSPDFTWDRVESSATFGFPDLVGFHEKYGLFTIELKVTKSKKVHISPHQVSHCIRHPYNHWILVQALDRSHWELYEAELAARLMKEGLLPHDTPGLHRLHPTELAPRLERLLADRLRVLACSLAPAP